MEDVDQVTISWLEQNRDSLPYREIASALVINKGGQLLLVQKNRYQPNQWDVVGGGIEEGETHTQATLRELSEELTSDEFEIIATSKLPFAYEWPPETSMHHYQKTGGELFRGQRKVMVGVLFKGNPDELAVREDEDLRTLCWVERAKLADYLIFPGQLEYIDTVIADLEPQLTEAIGD
jgi:8-oxo-dGTP pyrophosphatase MutT (NUDIX family)